MSMEEVWGKDEGKMREEQNTERKENDCFDCKRIVLIP
jgi:hypothetical protein